MGACEKEKYKDVAANGKKGITEENTQGKRYVGRLQRGVAKKTDRSKGTNNGRKEMKGIREKPKKASLCRAFRANKKKGAETMWENRNLEKIGFARKANRKNV